VIDTNLSTSRQMADVSVDVLTKTFNLLDLLASYLNILLAGWLRIKRKFG
jgi:hypothetical protein